MICFRISIFEPLKTTIFRIYKSLVLLWFAFELVSLNHWKQRFHTLCNRAMVVICFRISIFEPLKTTSVLVCRLNVLLWFAFELVSLNHWKQQLAVELVYQEVVICFRISIFEPLKTTTPQAGSSAIRLWFAFELVSLNHWKQLNICYKLITN